MHAVYISAAFKSSGKTLFAVGLTAAAHARAIAVRTFKKGPDYIDATWLSLAGNGPCVNLDFYTMSRREIQAAYMGDAEASDGRARLSLIEGTKGLHDGVATDGSDSNAELAAILDVPVVLVIDARGMTRGIAPLLRGLVEFDPRVSVRGVVLNRVAGTRHGAKLERAIGAYTDLSVLGMLPESPAVSLAQEHLGLVPGVEAAQAHRKVDQLAQLVEAHCDVETLLDAPTGVTRCDVDEREGDVVGTYDPGARYSIVCSDRTPSTSSQATTSARTRIGIAYDRAFCFYYAGDLARMRALGAELQFFDTLTDSSLPDVDAVMIGGGFPERWMAALEANESMRNSVHEFASCGKPLYAECGGLMYLSRRLKWDDQSRLMCGVLPIEITMRAKPQGRGYVRLRQSASAPWGIVGDNSDLLNAHEFHYSEVEIQEPNLQFAYEVERGFGMDGARDGIVYGNVLASYAHMRHTESSPWVDNFINWARRASISAPVRRTAEAVS